MTKVALKNSGTMSFRMCDFTGDETNESLMMTHIKTTSVSH